MVLIRAPILGPGNLFMTEVNRRGVAVASLGHGVDPTVCACAGCNGCLQPRLVAAASHGVDWSIEELIDFDADCNARTTIVSKLEPRKVLTV